MSLNIYYSTSSDACISKLLKNISPNDLTEENVIITPDRRGLLTEQELFSFSQTKSFFNVNVTTFTRFTNELISKYFLNDKKLLTKALAVAIIKKILLQEKDNLVSFKKSINFKGTAEKLFETLSMFKSCRITVSDLSTNTKNESLNNKLKDLKLVYAKYEEYLQTEYTDSFNKINLLSEILNTHSFKQTNFYFVGFDDFTPQIYDIIAKLVAKSKNVYVSTAASYDTDINNKNIYLNNVYLGLLDMSKNIGHTPNLVYCPAGYEGQKKWLSQNLFSYFKNTKDISESENKIKIAGFGSLADEVEFVTKTILFQVVNYNKRYSDFTVVVPNIANYKKDITSFFNREKIRYYIDENKKFSEHLLVRIYLNLFEMINSNFKAISVFDFLKSLTVLPAQEIAIYENFIAKTGHNGKHILKPLNAYSDEPSKNTSGVYAVLKLISEFSDSIKTAKNVSEFVNLLHAFNADINRAAILDSLLQKYEKQNNFTEARLLTQVNNKLNTAFEEITALLGNYETTFSDFASIFESYLNNITLSLPPIETDTVFVADSVNSFIDNNHTVFVLGANESVLPVTLNDLGIISDNDIKLLSHKNKLSPTVNYINKRNKFLLYEKLLKWTDALVITHLTLNDKNEELMPASFVMGIRDMFNINLLQNNQHPLYLNGQIILQKTGFYENVLEQAYESRYIFNNISINFVRENFINSIKDWFFYAQNNNYLSALSTLYQVVLNQDKVAAEQLVKNANFKNIYEKIDNAYDLFFASKTTSVSQFETYFKCPFKHFINYGLKLKESDTSEVDFRDFGIIIHDYVAEIMPHIALLKTQHVSHEELKMLSDVKFNKVIKHQNYESVYNNPKNKFTINSMKDECYRISKALLYEQQNSDFIPTGFEEYFKGETDKSLVLKSDGKEVAINGVVDRYDVHEDTFRVIDYKTGQSTFANYDELISGVKVQLFVYVMAVQEKLEKQCVGSFYMPLRNVYSKEEDADDLYKLQGVFENSLTTILSYDHTLSEPNTKSKIIQAATTKDGNISNRNKHLMLSKDDILWLSKYSLKLLNLGFKKMISGDIMPNPLTLKGKNEYKDTEFVGINNFNELYGNEFRTVKSVKNFNKTDLLFELNVLNGNEEVVFNHEFDLVNKSDFEKQEALLKGD